MIFCNLIQFYTILYNFIQFYAILCDFCDKFFSKIFKNSQSFEYIIKFINYVISETLNIILANINVKL